MFIQRPSLLTPILPSNYTVPPKISFGWLEPSYGLSVGHDQKEPCQPLYNHLPSLWQNSASLSNIEINGLGPIGAKARALHEKASTLKSAGAHLPQTIVLAQEFFDSLLAYNHKGKKLSDVYLFADDIMNLRFSVEHEQELFKILARLGSSQIMVRSSADLDAKGTGIYDTLISNPTMHDLKQAVLGVLRGYYSEKAILFRFRTGARPDFAMMFQPMKNPVVSGSGVLGINESDAKLKFENGFGCAVEGGLNKYNLKQFKEALYQNTIEDAELIAQKVIQFLNKLIESLNGPHYIEWLVTKEGNDYKVWVVQIAKTKVQEDINEEIDVLDKPAMLTGHDVNRSGIVPFNKIVVIHCEEQLEVLKEYNRTHSGFAVIYPASFVAKNNKLIDVTYVSNASVVLEMPDGHEHVHVHGSIGSHWGESLSELGILVAGLHLKSLDLNHYKKEMFAPTQDTGSLCIDLDVYEVSGIAVANYKKDSLKIIEMGDDLMPYLNAEQELNLRTNPVNILESQEPTQKEVTDFAHAIYNWLEFGGYRNIGGITGVRLPDKWRETVFLTRIFVKKLIPSLEQLGLSVEVIIEKNEEGEDVLSLEVYKPRNQKLDVLVKDMQESSWENDQFSFAKNRFPDSEWPFILSKLQNSGYVVEDVDGLITLTDTRIARDLVTGEPVLMMTYCLTGFKTGAETLINKTQEEIDKELDEISTYDELEAFLERAILVYEELFEKILFAQGFMYKTIYTVNENDPRGVFVHDMRNALYSLNNRKRLLRFFEKRGESFTSYFNKVRVRVNIAKGFLNYYCLT